MSTVSIARLLSLITLAMLAAGATLVPGGAAAQPTTAKNRLVVQVSDADPGKWNLALNNAKNVQNDLGAKNVDVEIVAYGPGIGMLKAESVVGNRIAEALKAGVKVVACENTMHGQKLTKADMLEGIDYAPAGVTEIMRRQQEGWAYVRP